jgi:hypothetical protein
MNDKASINVKMIEILCNIIQEQNIQLLQIISSEENIDLKSLSQLVPSRYEIKKNIHNYLREKSNSTSLSKLSSSSTSSTSSSEDE